MSFVPVSFPKSQPLKITPHCIAHGWGLFLAPVANPQLENFNLQKPSAENRYTIVYTSMHYTVAHILKHVTIAKHTLKYTSTWANGPAQNFCAQFFHCSNTLGCTQEIVMLH